MNYRFKNIDEVKIELEKKLEILKNESKEISTKINKISLSNEGIRKTLKGESEVMTIISGKAKLNPNNNHQLIYSFLQIIKFVIN